MHPADAAGGEHLDPRHLGQHHGGGHGGGAGLAGGQVDRHVPAAHLAHGGVLAHQLQFLGGKPHLQLAADDGGGGGDGPLPPDDLLHLVGELPVLRVGHPVGEDGGLQRHHRLAGLDGLGDLGGDGKILLDVHGTSSFRYVDDGLHLLDCDLVLLHHRQDIVGADVGVDGVLVGDGHSGRRHREGEGLFRRVPL